jgi:hypothetical protein
MPFEKAIRSFNDNTIARNENTRCYFFQNMYLPGIQVGIQSAHTVTEMAMKYRDNRKKDSLLFAQWATVDKVMIVLNGGYHSVLEGVESLFQNETNPYPWASFRESKEALNEALTNIGIVLPESIYRPARLFSRAVLNPSENDETVMGKGEELNVLQLRSGGVRLVYTNKDIEIKGNYTKFEMELMRTVASFNLMS